MTKEHALKAYKHYKDLLTNPKYLEKEIWKKNSKVWKENVQHGIDSILIRHPEFAEISEEKEESSSPPTTTKSKKEK